MSKVEWARPARSDLDAIGEYWLRHSPDRATLVADRLDDAARFLADLPRAGPQVHRTSRKWRVRGTDYILLYRPVATGIEILRVYHVCQRRLGA